MISASAIALPILAVWFWRGHQEPGHGLGIPGRQDGDALQLKTPHCGRELYGLRHLYRPLLTAGHIPLRTGAGDDR